MKRHLRTSVLACAVAGWVSGATAQEDCSAKINSIAKIGDIQAALNCVEGHIANEAARNKQQAENDKKEMLQQIDDLEILSTNVKHVALKEATNGVWQKIPDSENANACFLSSVRLPPQGLCQITYQGTQKAWTYNASDIAGAGFVCTATCVWVKAHRKPQAAE
jgi:hypothetical protein